MRIFLKGSNMPRKISVTAACNAANKYIGKPVKFGPKSWQVFYYAPRETVQRVMQANSYAKALTMVVKLKAFAALDMLAKSHGYVNSDNVPNHAAMTMLEIELINGAKWQDAVRKAHGQAITQ